MKREDLKIQFRSINDLYTDVKTLEYRINPEDENNIIEKRLLWGLIKYKKKINSCDWRRASFLNVICSIPYPYSTFDIVLDDEKNLDYYISKFETIGEFENYLNELGENYFKQLKNERNNNQETR